MVGEVINGLETKSGTFRVKYYAFLYLHNKVTTILANSYFGKKDAKSHFIVYSPSACESVCLKSVC